MSTTLDLPIRSLGTAYRRWSPPDPPLPRALVLGGGGATGIAWEAGLIQGLAALGVDLRTADTMIGTSAGSVVAAHARAGTNFDTDLDAFFDGETAVPPGRITPVDGVKFVMSQAIPSRRLGRAVLGVGAGRPDPEREAAWIATIGDRLTGAPWPAGLLITAVDARSGASVVFDDRSGVPLERAMAASCAVPGIYPSVEINGRRFVDGGVRTVTNVDLAAGHDRVVVIAPFGWALRRSDRPRAMLARLGSDVRSAVVVPDAASRDAIGRNVLDLSRTAGAAAAGRAQAQRVVDRVRDAWID